MSREAAVSAFMVKAGAFAVRGLDNSADDIKRIASHLREVRHLLNETEALAVGRAVALIARKGLTAKRIDRLMTALAGRAAALAAKKDAHEPCGLASKARMQMGVDLGGKDESAVTVMTPERHAAITARFPYKDDTLED